MFSLCVCVCDTALVPHTLSRLVVVYDSNWPHTQRAVLCDTPALDDLVCFAGLDLPVLCEACVLGEIVRSGP